MVRTGLSWNDGSIMCVQSAKETDCQVGHQAATCRRMLTSVLLLLIPVLTRRPGLTSVCCLCITAHCVSHAMCTCAVHSLITPQMNEGFCYQCWVWGSLQLFFSNQTSYVYSHILLLVEVIDWQVLFGQGRSYGPQTPPPPKRDKHPLFSVPGDMQPLVFMQSCRDHYSVHSNLRECTQTLRFFWQNWYYNYYAIMTS